MKAVILGIVLVSLGSCSTHSQDHQDVVQETTLDNKQTIQTRFDPPTGYQRLNIDSNSFQYFLRTFPLKSPGSHVYYFNGQKKSRKVHAAVLNIDTEKRDLQQCADAVMRLRGEYLFAQKAYNQLHFNFTNGFNCSYEKWQQGFRPKVSGNQVSWVKAAEPNSDYASFRKYMDMVFAYAGTHSLEKELQSVELKEIKIGDVFIQGGFPGHAVLVVDVAENDTGEKAFLLAQSYMPAQDIHVLKKPLSQSPWYFTADINNKLVTPEWVFNASDLKRFP
ncbi:MAG: DUF4846 domain-containing protein [Saprospiraceae bacterium]|nr:DUF4846 domain-containing protein [Saprospiraceae bacterium]